MNRCLPACLPDRVYNISLVIVSYSHDILPNDVHGRWKWHHGPQPPRHWQCLPRTQAENYGFLQIKWFARQFSFPNILTIFHSNVSFIRYQLTWIEQKWVKEDGIEQKKKKRKKKKQKNERRGKWGKRRERKVNAEGSFNSSQCFILCKLWLCQKKKT